MNNELELGAAYELAVDAIDGVLFSENPHRAVGAERELCERLAHIERAVEKAHAQYHHRYAEWLRAGLRAELAE